MTFVDPTASSDWSQRAWLKSRRPEEFSDSQPNSISRIDRSFLEFQLDSLTSRSQEADFEKFARRLCSLEVCPNLLPQTGPTGGGDSKVDSETYPVAEQLALTWYVGHGSSANTERWGFAFSTMKRWKPKVLSDIKKLVGTGRGYSKAFFVSNQAISARARAQVEDKLRKDLGIEVRILDRTWILDRVFTNRRQQVVVEELHVDGVHPPSSAIGPTDASREAALTSLEDDLRDAVASGRPTLAHVDQALEIAILARGLDRPRSDVRGLFARADNLAEKFGTSRHQVEAAYERARTEFWWHEDLDAFRSVYAIVEKRVRGSRNVYDLQKLANLWMLLDAEVLSNRLPKANHDDNTATLVDELDRIAANKDRPSAALQATSSRLTMRLFRSIKDRARLDSLLDSFGEVVVKSTDLPGFPLAHVTKPLVEMGQQLEHSPRYGPLFERIVEVESARRGEIDAARLRLKRGAGQLAAAMPVEAISTLGTALRQLLKHETRNDAARALYLSGLAYEKIGLLWAARGTLVFAASLATDSYWEHGDITNAQVFCFRHLKYLEYCLGRIPQLLCWHELHTAARLNAPNHKAARYADADEDEVQFDMLLGRLLLRAGLPQLDQLSRLPDVLETLDLPFAAAALEFALGHEAKMTEIAGTLETAADSHAQRWRDLTSEPPGPDTPELGDGKYVTMRSRIMGCRVTATAEIRRPCVEVAESILAVLESFLATSMVRRAIGCQHSAAIRIEIGPPETEVISAVCDDSSGAPMVSVMCQQFDPYALTPEQQVRVNDAIFSVVAQIVPRIVYFKDPQRDLEELFRDERAGDRASGFAGNLGGIPNVLGSSPKTTIASWVEESVQAFPLLRSVAWDERIPQAPQRSLPAAQTVEGTFDPRQLAHNKVEVSPLMRLPVWEAAGWRGALFMIDPSYSNDPILGLIFDNEAPGLKIFEQWFSVLGGEDANDQLRVAAVTGIDTRSPYSYRMVVGPNPAAMLKGAGVAASFSRLHRMDPADSRNLTGFFSAYRGRGGFRLAPAFMEGHEPRVVSELGIRLKRFYLRNAWEIDCNELDAVAICVEDSPVIPSHAATTAPVLRRLAQLRERAT